MGLVISTTQLGVVGVGCLFGHLIGRMRVASHKSRTSRVCLTPTGGSVSYPIGGDLPREYSDSRRGDNTSGGTPSARLGRWTGFFMSFLADLQEILAGHPRPNHQPKKVE